MRTRGRGVAFSGGTESIAQVRGPGPCEVGAPTRAGKQATRAADGHDHECGAERERIAGAHLVEEAPEVAASIQAPPARAKGHPAGRQRQAARQYQPQQIGRASPKRHAAGPVRAYLATPRRNITPVEVRWQQGAAPKPPKIPTNVTATICGEVERSTCSLQA